MESYFMGVDVGTGGAIAIIDKEGIIMEIIKTPATIQDFLSFLDKWKNEKIFCLVEKVHSFPGNSHKVAFTFGEINGITKAVLEASKIPYDLITPQRWMAFYGLKKSATQTMTDWKNELLKVAQRLFPKEKIYLYQADAVLIAEYTRRNYFNTHSNINNNG